MRCLVFGSEEAAIAANTKIWAGRVRQTSQKGDNRVGYHNNPLTQAEVNELSDAQAADLLIYGVKSGMQAEDGSSRWANINMIYGQERWYLKKPDDDSLLDGVSGYIEEDFNHDWLPPDIQ